MRTTHHPSASAAITPRRALGAFAGLNALAAFGGALGLITGALGLGELEARLPFASPVVGGLALAAWVGIPLTVVAVLAWRGDERLPAALVLAGGLLISWIVVELALVRAFSPLQAFYVVVGVLFIRAGRGAERATP